MGETRSEKPHHELSMVAHAFNPSRIELVIIPT